MTGGRKESTDGPRGPRAGIFTLFLLLSLAVYFVSVTFAHALPTGPAAVIRLLMAGAFLAVGVRLRRRSPANQLWKGFYALFAATLALFVSWWLSDWGYRALGLSLESAPGLAVAKLSSAILTVGVILVAVRAVGEDPGSVLLQRGNLRLGVGVGVGGFGVLTALGLLQAFGSGVGAPTLLAVAPWVALFIFANGLLEEILFRGLFLERLRPLVGAWPANLLTAIAFTAAHAQVGYAPEMAVFLVILFGLALAWGLLIQKSQSVLGSAIFHAGADTLVVLQIFASYNALS